MTVRLCVVPQFVVQQRCQASKRSQKYTFSILCTIEADCAVFRSTPISTCPPPPFFISLCPPPSHIHPPCTHNSIECKRFFHSEHVTMDDPGNRVLVQFTPTIPHCSMATLIGLSIRVRLLRSIPRRFKVDVEIYPGSHASREAVNKQLADKERVAAALENAHLVEAVNNCIKDI